MKQEYDDMTHKMMLDGNGVAGKLHEVFNAEMTSSPTQCAHCGWKGVVAQLLAFTKAPGVILRCPGCGNPMLRLAGTPQFTYLDARGAVFLRIAK